MTSLYHGLHHVQLAIPPQGEDVARQFYGDVLGLEELEKPPGLAARGGCWFRAGGLEVHLGVEANFVPARKAHPGVLVTDIDALAAKLEGAGSPVEWDANFPGHRRFYSADGHGNRLEFLQPQRARPAVGPTMTAHHILAEKLLHVEDGELQARESWVYVWARGGDVIYVGATALPPAVRTWLHLHDDDPTVGRIAAAHPEALTGQVEVRAFGLAAELDRREVRQAVMSLVANEVSTADDLSHPEWAAAIEIVDRLAKQTPGGPGATRMPRQA